METSSQPLDEIVSGGIGWLSAQRVHDELGVAPAIEVVIHSGGPFSRAAKHSVVQLGMHAASKALALLRLPGGRGAKPQAVSSAAPCRGALGTNGPVGQLLPIETFRLRRAPRGRRPARSGCIE
jgi:hypothetical protein